VSLVAILDADKEGFLRSAGALIQTMGDGPERAWESAAHADRMTDSMKGDQRDRTAARGAGGVHVQHDYAGLHCGTSKMCCRAYERDYVTIPRLPMSASFRTRAELDAFIAKLEREMREAAASLEFERAAAMRDRLRKLRNPDLVDLAREAP
jgi:excinuclease ABC subunit B